jgi:hypothetical protein
MTLACRLAASALFLTSLLTGLGCSSGAGGASPSGDDGGSTGDAGTEAAQDNPCGDAGTLGPVAQVVGVAEQVQGLAAGPERVYWSTPCSSCGSTDDPLVLWMASPTGESLSLIHLAGSSTGTPAVPQLLTVDGSLLWFINADGLQHVNLDGTNPTIAAAVLDGVQGDPYGIAFDDANVYLLGAETDHAGIIVSVPKTGGSASIVARWPLGSDWLGHGLVVDSSRVYWSQSPDGGPGASIDFAPKAGGSPSALTTPSTLVTLDALGSITIAAGQGDEIVAAMLEDTTGSGPQIVAVHTASPKVPPVILATSGTAPFAVSGADLFFASEVYQPNQIPGMATAMQACSRGGPGIPLGAVPTVAPTFLAVGGGHVFYGGPSAPSDIASAGVWSLPQ